VTYKVDGATVYIPNENFNIGDTVQIEDQIPLPPATGADGFADTVEVDG
jgi:hypothetical protein